MSKNKSSSRSAKVQPLTADELKDKLVESIAAIPSSFRLEGKKGIFRVSPSESSIDPETGEESFVVQPLKGEGSLGPFNAAALKLVLKPLKSGAKDKHPQGKGGVRAGLKPHVELYAELIRAGKSRDEIFEAMKEAFTAHNRKADHENVLSDKNVRSRIHLYRWQATTRYEDVRKIVTQQRIDDLKERSKKPVKETKKAASKEEQETTAKPAAKKGKKALGKTPEKQKPTKAFAEVEEQEDEDEAPSKDW